MEDPTPPSRSSSPSASAAAAAGVASNAAVGTAAAAATAPIQDLDIVLSFDTTGSMHSILRQVRNELARVVDVLFTQSAARGIRVRLAVIAQGDYGGRIAIDDSVPTCGSDYTVIATPFCSDPALPVAFIREVDCSAYQSSEAGEAYEQVLRMANRMAWNPSATAKKVLILVGDDVAHTTGCRENVDRVDWRTEAASLGATGVQIFAIQCQTCFGDSSTAFYRELGSHGVHLLMSQFSSIVTLLLASFYTATTERTLVEGLEAELIARNRYSRNLEVVFNTLLDRPDARRAALVLPSGGATGTAASGGAATGSTAAARIPVTPGRFQRLAVSADTTIKDFVTATGARYKAGGGYYELTKPEDISAKKNVVMEHIASGEMFTGEDARALLGLSATVTKAGARSVPVGYRAFVQSTSHTRKLIAGTSFLWEVDPTA